MIRRLAGSLWFRGLLTVVVLTVLARRIDFQATLAALLRLSPVVAAAVMALVFIDRGAMVWRWKILLTATGTAISTRSAIWIHLVSSFVGAFLPAGVGADAARAYSLSLRTSQRNEAVASVSIDRLLGFLSLLMMCLIGVVAARDQVGSLAGVIGLAVAVIGGSAAFLWADRWIRAVLPAGWHQSRLGTRVLRLADAVSEYRDHRGALTGVFVLSIGVQILRILQAWLLGRGIGIDVPFAYYLFFMPIGLVALMLPISVSGFGVPQAVIVWLLRPRGVSEHDALALSTLIVLSGLLSNLPGAWLYLRRRQP